MKNSVGDNLRRFGTRRRKRRAESHVTVEVIEQIEGQEVPGGSLLTLGLIILATWQAQRQSVSRAYKYVTVYTHVHTHHAYIYIAIDEAKLIDGLAGTSGRKREFLSGKWQGGQGGWGFAVDCCGGNGWDDPLL